MTTPQRPSVKAIARLLADDAVTGRGCRSAGEIVRASGLGRGDVDAALVELVRMAVVERVVVHDSVGVVMSYRLTRRMRDHVQLKAKAK